MSKSEFRTQAISRRSLLLSSAALALGGPSVAALADHAARRGKSLTLAQKVAQLFVVSFGGVIAPDPGFLSLLRRHPLGGVILYGRNCRNAAQVRALVQSLQRASTWRLLVCTDQEGGEVVRITQGVNTFPSEAAYGKAGSVQRVQADAATSARQLRSIGLTMNLAPVVDVLTNPRSPIGDRSFGPIRHWMRVWPRGDSWVPGERTGGDRQTLCWSGTHLDRLARSCSFRTADAGTTG